MNNNLTSWEFNYSNERKNYKRRKKMTNKKPARISLICSTTNSFLQNRKFSNSTSLKKGKTKFNRKNCYHRRMDLNQKIFEASNLWVNQMVMKSKGFYQIQIVKWSKSQILAASFHLKLIRLYRIKKRIRRKLYLELTETQINNKIVLYIRKVPEK